MNLSKAKLLFSQKDVHVILPPSELIIRGNLEIVQKDSFIFLCWIISDLDKPILKYSKQYINKSTYKTLYQAIDVSTVLNPDNNMLENKDTRLIEYSESYIIKHGLCMILRSECQSFECHSGTRTVDFTSGISLDEIFLDSSYVKLGNTKIHLFYLSDPKGSANLLKLLRSLFWLKNSTLHPEVYHITDVDGFLESPIVSNNSLVSKLGESAVYLSGNFFEIIQFLPELSPNTSNNIDSFTPLAFFDCLEGDIHNNSGIEPLINVNTWSSYFDSAGRLLSLEQLKNDIFEKGVVDEYKIVCYKYILGYYSPEMTLIERENFDSSKIDEYNQLKDDLNKLTFDESKIEKLEFFHGMIAKDVPRCDRTHSYYSDPNGVNLETLKEILNISVFHNFSIGYDQCMTDLLSPLLYFIKNKYDTFWCFVYMINSKKMFNRSVNYFYDMLCDLALIIKFCFPKFYILHNDDLFFIASFYGRLKLDFKRDYQLEDILRLWEVMWTQTLTSQFHLLICVKYISKLVNSVDYTTFEEQDLIKWVSDHPPRNSKETIDETIMIINSMKSAKNLPEFINKLFY